MLKPVFTITIEKLTNWACLEKLKRFKSKLNWSENDYLSGTFSISVRSRLNNRYIKEV